MSIGRILGGLLGLLVIAGAIGEHSRTEKKQAQAAKVQEREIEEASAAGRVLIGMSKQQILQAWGKPERINRSIGQARESEQWIYERKSGDVYLYIENGVLSSFQDSR